MVGASALLFLALATGQTAPVAKIQVGDKLRVVVTEDATYNGEYVVMDDGSVTGVGFGRIVVAEKTVEQAREAIRIQLQKILRQPTVSLVVVEQKQKFVFVTSVAGTAPGPITFEAGLDVRRVITGVVVPGVPEDYEVRLFREGVEIGRDSLFNVLKGLGEFGSKKLTANDVVTLAEVVKHRIYVGGEVRTPGEFRVLEGTDALQAVALAGGSAEESAGEIAFKIQVRRGINVFEVDNDPLKPRFTLEAGDTVLVVTPERIRVSLGGSVTRPGEQTMRAGADLFEVIQKGGGLNVEGSLADVLVIRDGQSYIVDLSNLNSGTVANPFKVEDGDLVFVRRNERRIIVLGFVRSPKPIRMTDSRTYRLADAVSEAGGPDARGTYHRVYVGRKDETGKVVVSEYRLAAFLKDGDLSQNPELQPDDVVMVGEVKGITIREVGAILSNALLLDSLFRR